MSDLEGRNCPVCAASAGDKVFENVFAGIFDSDITLQVVCCRACGMVYVPEHLSDAKLSEYYRLRSAYEYPENNYDAIESVKKKDRRQFEYLRQYLPAGAAVLDIGSSQGHLLSLFKNEGCEVLGIEPSAKLKAIARELYGVELISAFIDRDFDPGRQFDLVILSHVVEHLRWPIDVLQAVGKNLTPEGLVFIEVPCIEEFDERDLFQFSFEHINYFSHGSLADLMHQAGFEEVDHLVFENDGGVVPFYPTLGSLWRKTTRSYPLRSRHAHNRRVIGRYVALVNRHAAQLHGRIAEALARHGRIAIWGAGTLTAQLLAQTALGRAEIAVIYDNDPKRDGQSMCNIPIRKPQPGPDLLKADGIDAIVIGSWSSQEEILQQLASHGIPAGQLVKLFKN